MKEIIILGAGGHTRSLIGLIESTKQYNIQLIIDLIESGSSSKTDEIILGIPVVKCTLDDSIENFNHEQFAAVGIGDNHKRAEAYKFLRHNNILCPALVHSRANLEIGSELGLGSQVFAFAHIGPNVFIGEAVIINTNSVIEHESTVDNYSHVCPNATIAGRVKIGELSMVGAGAVVRDTVHICSNTVLGAGAVCVQHIQSSGTYVGVPAKPI